MRTEKVTNIENTGRSFEKSGKKFNVFTVKFESGLEAETFTPEDEPRFKEGEQASFNLREVEYKGEKKNVVSWDYDSERTKDASQGETSGGRNKSYAISYAKDIVVAKIESGGKFDKESFFSLAEEINKWLEE